jgi:hypothetical protein
VVHVASSRRSCGVEVEVEQVNVMSYIKPFYLKIVVFIVFIPKCIVVF